MENKNKYWKGLEELNRDPSFVQANKNEFAEGLPLDEVLNENNLSLTSNRRDFLKYFGFSISAVALAACNTAPVKNVIPYVIKPEEVAPGVPNWYASTYGNTPVLVKTREGRPIKLEGNDKSSVTMGGLDADAHASLLSLYDNERLDTVFKEGKPVEWKDADKEITGKLASIAAAGGAIRIVSSTINSPSTLAAIEEFTAKYPTTKHVTYDAISYSSIINANNASFGKAVVPSYKFDNAQVIVGFGADFLGTWISPVEYSKQWVKNRRLINGEKEMSRHYQFESLLTITGSKADIRMPMKPSQEGAAVVSLYNEIAKQSGMPALSGGNLELGANTIKQAAKDLLKNKGKSLVVSGSNDMNVQLIVNGINAMLGNYGTTIDLDNPSMQYKGMDQDMETFVTELNSGSVKAVIFYDTNPAYNYYNASKISEGLKKADLKISLSSSMDETAVLCTYVCPDNHFLESWGDAQIKAGVYGFIQPTIQKVFNTRQAQESLLTWAGNTTDFYTYVKNNWQKNIFSRQTKHTSFTSFWNESLQMGVFEMEKAATQPYSLNANLSDAASKLGKGGQGIEFIAYQSSSLRDGKDANNPWLQELPDPISKVTWDNYASIAKVTADALKVEEGDTVNVTIGQLKIENLPVIVQPGQAKDTVAIALGYGRKNAGKVGNDLGVNVYPTRKFENGGYNNIVTGGVSVEKGSKSYELARTQTHHSIEGRDLIKESTLAEYQADPRTRNHNHNDLIKDPKKGGQFYSLWTEHDNKGHKWGMAIDLNACTGCGACIVSCNAENNVPVVGREEVRRRREMHWIRIDRYYRFSPDTVNAEDKQLGRGFTESGDIGLASDGYEEHPEYFENVSVSFQPVMCQHCGHAPCETVCPVLATTHSTEGMNQMTYNRCIGTKYCANNCPYKVRRFNWFRFNDNKNFDYYLNNDLGKMVINPDVTVRTRGVMEKCSFCVQRIQYGKLQAKLQNRKVEDGEIKTACQQSCPTGAIVFGDLKDPNSEISKLFRNERSYHMLDELNVQPSVAYMTMIRNVEAPAGAPADAHGKAKTEEKHEEHHNH